jgi:DNA-directed RNA polymerase subunit E'
MYKIFDVSDKIRVPPDKLGMKLEEAVKTSLEEKLEGSLEKSLGVILAVMSVEKIGEGLILPGDGALYFPVDFSVLTYVPEQHEVVKGEVIDVTEFGVFIRMGPVDGMVHVSQLMDDFVSYDSKNLMFTGKKTKRRIKEKSIVMARVISVSMAENQYKIGLTTRQPGLGAIEWFTKEEKEEAHEKKQEEHRKEERKEKKKKK